MLHRTSSESWLFGQQASSLMSPALGNLRSQLTVVLRSGEKSPCARAVVAHMSELWEKYIRDGLFLRLTQRSNVKYDTRFFACVADWSFRPVPQRCLPANSIAFSRFEHVSMDNLDFCVNKRGDDPELGS